MIVVIALLWFVLVIALCWFCPWWIGALIWVANLFIPDLILFLDELLSLPGPIRQYLKVAKAARCVKRVNDRLQEDDKINGDD